MTAGPKTSHEKGGEYVWKRNKIAVARAFFTPCHLWIQPLDMIGKPLFRIFYPSFLSSSLFKDFVKDKSNL